MIQVSTQGEAKANYSNYRRLQIADYKLAALVAGYSLSEAEDVHVDSVGELAVLVARQLAKLHHAPFPVDLVYSIDRRVLQLPDDRVEKTVKRAEHVVVILTEIFEQPVLVELFIDKFKLGPN